MATWLLYLAIWALLSISGYIYSLKFSKDYSSHFTNIKVQQSALSLSKSNEEMNSPAVIFFCSPGLSLYLLSFLTRMRKPRHRKVQFHNVIFVISLWSLLKLCKWDQFPQYIKLKNYLWMICLHNCFCQNLGINSYLSDILFGVKVFYLFHLYYNLLCLHCFEALRKLALILHSSF